MKHAEKIIFGLIAATALFIIFAFVYDMFIEPSSKGSDSISYERGD